MFCPKLGIWECMDSRIHQTKDIPISWSERLTFPALLFLASAVSSRSDNESHPANTSLPRLSLRFGKLCQTSLATKLDPATECYLKFKINAVMSRYPCEGQNCSMHHLFYNSYMLFSMWAEIWECSLSKSPHPRHLKWSSDKGRTYSSHSWRGSRVPVCISRQALGIRD